MGVLHRRRAVYAACAQWCDVPVSRIMSFDDKPMARAVTHLHDSSVPCLFSTQRHDDPKNFFLSEVSRRARKACAKGDLRRAERLTLETRRRLQGTVNRLRRDWLGLWWRDMRGCVSVGPLPGNRGDVTFLAPCNSMRSNHKLRPGQPGPSSSSSGSQIGVTGLLRAKCTHGVRPRTPMIFARWHILLAYRHL